MKFNLPKIVEFIWRWLPTIMTAHFLTMIIPLDIDITQKVWLILACIVIIGHFAIKYYDSEKKKEWENERN